jgi:C-terminal processing protease CtpA/Prc
MYIKKLSGLGELSATGMYMETGIFVKEIKEDSPWHRRGVRANDVLLNIDEQDLENVHEAIENLKNDIKQIVIWRNQGKEILS